VISKRHSRSAAREKEENVMATNVKQMLEAANAAVPRITPSQAREIIAKDNTLIVDVRDAPEVAASGKVAGAVHVSRERRPSRKGLVVKSGRDEPRTYRAVAVRKAGRVRLRRPPFAHR
jgi:hypothetical protein